VDLGNVTVEVIGVVKDFHFATIRHKVEPLMMFFSPQNSQMALKVDAQNLNQTLADIEATWKRVNPETPFEYNFLDAEFANLYRNDQAFASMFLHFAILAILDSLLGLIRIVSLHSRTTAKRNQHQKGVGCISGQYHDETLHGVYWIGQHRHCPGHHPLLFCNEPMAAGFPIPDPNPTVGISRGRIDGHTHYSIDHKFPNHQSHFQ
jgi:hypothetical protein